MKDACGCCLLDMDYSGFTSSAPLIFLIIDVSRYDYQGPAIDKSSDWNPGLSEPSSPLVHLVIP